MSQEMMRPVVVAQPKKSHGCLYGCLIALALVLVLLIAAGVAGYYGLVRLVEAFTDEEPMPLPTVEITPEHGEELRGRVEDFIESLEGEGQVEPLVLTQDDINGLVQTDPDWDKLKGKVFVSLEDDEISGQVSVRLDELDVPFLQGRYFNASVTFSIFMRDGLLHVYIRSAEVKGKPVADWIMAELRTQNLAREAMSDPDTAEVLERFESIEVRDGKLVIVPAPVAEAATDSEVIELVSPEDTSGTPGSEVPAAASGGVT